MDWAEETVSLSAVVSRVASVWPAVTFCPGVTATVATWPPTWNEAAASLTGSTLPTTVRVVPMSARGDAGHAVAGRPPLTVAHAATPPPMMTASDDGADEDGAPVAGRPQPDRDLGTATPEPSAAAGKPPPPKPATAEAAACRCRRWSR